MSLHNTRGYSSLRRLLFEIGANFIDSGDAIDNLEQQVYITLLQEQSLDFGVTLYWDIDQNGNEIFVCQE